MDSLKSFKGYGKVDEAEQQAFRRKTRKRFIIVGVSSVILLAVVIGAIIGVVLNKKDENTPGTSSSIESPQKALKAVCSATQYPDSCFSTISALESSKNTTDPESFFKLSLQVALKELNGLIRYTTNQISDNKSVQRALQVCNSVFNDALDSVNETVTTSNVDDIKTWLSTSLTYQQTCLDSIDELNMTDKTIYKNMEGAMRNSTEFVSNSLAISVKILALLSKFKIPSRRLLDVGSGYPDWVGVRVRRLLQAEAVKPNVTVAADGSGDVTSIKAAVDMVPKKSVKRFVIYVKKGEYKENVFLDKSKWNVMMYGDGKSLTVVSGSLNNVDGVPTYDTATVIVAGKGFIAKDMKFINTAGPEKHQAVAFRSNSDESVFYQCSFDAYQDTLYAHSNRQFYRDCDITGTIDFIFGNAAVVFQNCNIMPRQPLPNQFNTITAQGKKDKNQNTGISIQKCKLLPKDLNLTAKTYLGRPWKEFSTTVIMQSEIGSFLEPLGWMEWTANVVPPSSIFYGEYLNTGPGSGVGGRVSWAGYRPSLSSGEADRFTVKNFIQGGVWLPASSVLFDESL